MSILYTLLEQARAARAKLEEQQAQAASLYAGAKDVLIVRIRKLETAVVNGDEEATATLLRLDRKIREMRGDA